MTKTIVSCALAIALTSWCPAAPIPGVTFACSESNDLYAALQFSGQDCTRVTTPAEAADKAGDGESLFILADGYPTQPTKLGPDFWTKVHAKHLRLYVEFPSDVPGLTLGPVRGTDWQREVITSDAFGQGLPKMHIVQQHDCHFLPTTADQPWITIARVAGYDSAIYGLPKDHWPALLDTHDHQWLIATTKLSHFVTGRYAPAADWGHIWETILSTVAPNHPWQVQWRPTVHPAYASAVPLPDNAELTAFTNFANWIPNSRLLVSADRAPEINRLLTTGAELTEPTTNSPGDGTHGILEGYSSQVRFDGPEPQRLPLRADCNTEIAMALSLDWSLRRNPIAKSMAANLLNYVYTTSGMCSGDRGDPHSPAYGLIAWGATAPAWLVANYGDDNARALLATMAAGAALDSQDWDQPLLRGLLANLRTTGKLGFRGDRIDTPALMKTGWQPLHDASPVNYSPHFESYLWACYLWAYSHTHEPEFLDRAKTAIKMTMAAYPDQWRWGDNNERSRMLLCLSWLIRLEDTPEHRAWLTRIATDLLSRQQPSGAIQEHLKSTGGGHYQIPQTNEAYGTGETPLIQSNNDPASDQLYTTGFTLLGLHEAAAATNDPALKKAEDKLADYLCRIQIKSDLPYLNGTWFRAFDYNRWDYYASSADLGWGVWSIEAGWGQASTAATLALRQKHTTLWDLTSTTRIHSVLDKVKAQMSQTTPPAPPDTASSTPPAK